MQLWFHFCVTKVQYSWFEYYSLLTEAVVIFGSLAIERRFPRVGAILRGIASLFLFFVWRVLPPYHSVESREVALNRAHNIPLVLGGVIMNDSHILGYFKEHR